MNQYEVTFIVDPVLSDTEIKQTSENYVDLLKTEGCQIVHVDEMGLRQLAYQSKSVIRVFITVLNSNPIPAPLLAAWNWLYVVTSASCVS